VDVVLLFGYLNITLCRILVYRARGACGTAAGLETHARLPFNPLPFPLVVLVLTDGSFPWRHSAFRLRVESSKIGLAPFRNSVWHNTEFEGLGPRRGGSLS
jgi:hypothetical protein